MFHLYISCYSRRTARSIYWTQRHQEQRTPVILSLFRAFSRPPFEGCTDLLPSIRLLSARAPLVYWSVSFVRHFSFRKQLGIHWWVLFKALIVVLISRTQSTLSYNNQLDIIHWSIDDITLIALLISWSIGTKKFTFWNANTARNGKGKAYER